MRRRERRCQEASERKPQAARQEEATSQEGRRGEEAEKKLRAASQRRRGRWGPQSRLAERVGRCAVLGGRDLNLGRLGVAQDDSCVLARAAHGVGRPCYYLIVAVGVQGYAFGYEVADKPLAPCARRGSSLPPTSQDDAETESQEKGRCTCDEHRVDCGSPLHGSRRAPDRHDPILYATGSLVRRPRLLRDWRRVGCRPFRTSFTVQGIEDGGAWGHTYLLLL